MTAEPPRGVVAAANQVGRSPTAAPLVLGLARRTCRRVGVSGRLRVGQDGDPRAGAGAGVRGVRLAAHTGHTAHHPFGTSAATGRVTAVGAVQFSSVILPATCARLGHPRGPRGAPGHDPRISALPSPSPGHRDRRSGRVVPPPPPRSPAFWSGYLAAAAQSKLSERPGLLLARCRRVSGHGDRTRGFGRRRGRAPRASRP